MVGIFLIHIVRHLFLEFGRGRQNAEVDGFASVFFFVLLVDWTADVSLQRLVTTRESMATTEFGSIQELLHRAMPRPSILIQSAGATRLVAQRVPVNTDRRMDDSNDP